jgi:hypothetical protein
MQTQQYMPNMGMGQPMPMGGQMGYPPGPDQQYYGAQGYPPQMAPQQQAFQPQPPLADQQPKSKKSTTKSSQALTSKSSSQGIQKAISQPKQPSQQQQQQQSPTSNKPPSPVDSIAGGGNAPEALFETEDFDPGDETDSNIRVIIRVRPPNQLELKNGYTQILECDANHRSIWIASQDGRDRPLSFNRVYDQDVSQGRFFEESGIKDLICKSLDG